VQEPSPGGDEKLLAIFGFHVWLDFPLDGDKPQEEIP
jgi:hypothetical protein